MLALLATGWISLPLQAQRVELTDKNTAPVAVESALVTTEVTGRIAVTTFDLTFYNPNSRVLEGTFLFPLLDGQSVVRFALDVNGRLREAVPVDKARGQVVFEQIERRGVDPGLLEQTAGNNYRARIYPLPAHGRRRVVIAYQEDVARTSGQPAYRLNLDFPEPLKTFRLALTAYAAGRTPAQVRTTLALELPAWRDGKFLEIERTNFTARGLVELSLPLLEHPRVLTERFREQEYFYAEVPVIGASKPRPAPRVVGLLWDSSGSGRERDHQREFTLLDAWFATVGSVEVRLINLRDHASAPVSFKVQGGDWSALKRELENTIYDGATSLDGLKDDPAVGEWLLFSDGLLNYGTASARLPLHGTVHAVLASPRADPAWLRGLANRQAGEFVNLLEMDPARAAAVLRSESLRVLGIEHNPEAAAQVFPEPGAAVTGGTLVITGILRRPEATLSLRLGHHDGDARAVEVTVHAGENPGHLAARGWAASKISFLATDHAANREDIRRTSREFGIVTPDTSLIVLETVADYVRYDITPPDELLAEWNAQRQAVAGGRQKTHDEHREMIVSLFKERLAWWEKNFPKDTPPPPSKETVVPEPVPTTPGRPAPPPHAIEDVGDALPAATPGAVSPFTLDADEEVHLSAFAVETDETVNYRAATTLAGSRASAPARVAMDASGMDGGGVSLSIPESNDQAKGEGSTAAPTQSETAATISLQRWSPDTGYLERLRRASPGQAYAVYLEERTDHARQPGFFLDVADFFFERGDGDTALRILSNLAELELEDVALLRVLAQRLVQADRPDLALPLFERVLALRPDEPQSHRDLALTCAALKQYQRAVDLLWVVVDRPWDSRFPEIELIALSELNAIAATGGQKLDLGKVDPRLQKNLPVDLRAVLTWDANDCDIDLWVTDPNGETARYDHPLTYQGGCMSRDFTQGYGPEEFMLRAPKSGPYRVQINYYGDRRQTALGPVTVQVRLITGFGAPAQREKRLTVRLQDRQQTLDIGAIDIGVAK
ncbi:MAG: VIT domain-containing protein [Opitutaceae bacterium]|nr:VIT domain-containing protein [Opitutaceae bacterium]